MVGAGEFFKFDFQQYSRYYLDNANVNEVVNRDVDLDFTGDLSQSCDVNADVLVVGEVDNLNDICES